MLVRVLRQVYGDATREYFDPIKSDTWSYGAVIYYMARKKYPYKPKKTYENLDKRLSQKVAQSSFSDSGKELMLSLLRTNADKRLPIGLIEKDVWFKKAKNVSKVTFF